MTRNGLGGKDAGGSGQGPSTVQAMAAAVDLFRCLEAVHRNEEVEAYLALFAHDCVWVTSRGVCYRGADELGDYVRAAIPGGLNGGSVSYWVESIRPITGSIIHVVVDQQYTDATGQARDGRARHTHTYLIDLQSPMPLILAGQNTVNVANPAL